MENIKKLNIDRLRKLPAHQLWKELDRYGIYYSKRDSRRILLARAESVKRFSAVKRSSRSKRIVSWFLA